MFSPAPLRWLLSSLCMFFVGSLLPLHGQIDITTKPTLQSPTASTMTVVWVTDKPSTGWVYYGPLDGELKTAFTSHDGLIEADQRVHKVVLRDLKPGVTYRYCVSSQEQLDRNGYHVRFGESVTSEFRQFQAFDLKKERFSFAVFNDVHSDKPLYRISATPDMLKVAGGDQLDFAVFNGDIFSQVNSETEVTNVLDVVTENFAFPAKPHWRALPLYWVRGNHETRGRFASRLIDYIGSPGGRYYYAFDQGPVHFIVLDTGEDKVDEHKEYSGLADFFAYRKEEGQWLKDAVRTEAFRRAKYRVVICHMPFASKKGATAAAPALGMPDAFQQFGGTLNEAGIDLMICGHMHQAAIVSPEEGFHAYPIVQGGGPKEESRTVIRVDAGPDALEARILRPDGSSAGECRVPVAR